MINNNQFMRKGFMILVFSLLISLSGISAMGSAEASTEKGGGKPSKETYYKVGEEITIAAGEMEEEEPATAWDGTNYFVVWEDKRDGAFDIYGSRVNAGGEVLDPRGIPISTAASDQIRPRIIWNGENYFVVWQDKRGNQDWEVYGTRLTSGGKVLDPGGIPISTGKDDRATLSMTWNGKELFLVWETRHPAPSKSDIYGARITSEGKVLDPGGIPIVRAPDEQYYAGVSWDGQNYLVVWSDRRSGEAFDIYGTRISPEGRVMDPKEIAISHSPADQYYPSIAWNGKVHLVVWMDMRGREEKAAIYGARMTPEGRVLDPEGVPIADSPEFHAVPFVIAKGEEFLVLWEREKKVTHKDIYAVRMDSSGRVLDPEPIGIITEFEHQSQVSVSTDGKRYFIVWMDYRTGIPFEGEIYGRFLDFSTPQPHSSALMSSEGEGRLGPFLIHQISIHPRDTGIVYAATSHYGILKSEDHGQEWVLFNQGLKSYTHRAIVIHPAKPEILYTGSWGGGMSKSSDSGRTWQEINTNLGDTAVTAIVLHPDDPDEVYAVSESGVFRSRNGGMLWESVNQGLPRSPEEVYQTLLILPDKPRAMYLGSSDAIYQWNEEAGEWVVVRKIAGENITTLNYSKGSKTLYAGTLSSGLFKSADEGKTWETVKGVDTFWIREIVFDPVNPDIIYLAMKGQGVLKTTDRGKIWQLQNNGLPDVAIQSLAMAPDDHNTLYAGTYEDGIVVSHNAGESWEGARSTPWLTSVEVMNSLPADEDMRSPEDIEMIVHSPSVAEHVYVSEDKEMMPPPSFVKCNRCHGWTDPFLNLRRTYWRVPANPRDWGFTVKQRMSHRSGLTQEEEEELIEFLERYSRRSHQQGSFKTERPAMESPGETVRRICSQCHGLEVNGLCLAGDCSKGEGVHRTGGRQWSFVVDWMRSMGAKMNDQEQQRITDYLTETYPSKPYPLAWEKVATLSGGGWNVTSLTAMGPHIYAGTEGGGRIYRSADGAEWEEVLNTGEYTVYGITEFKGAYFAGANSPVPEIWKSLDGKEWSKRAVLPEDQEGILSMGVFKDHLYAGTGRGKIFRSPDGERWEEVAILKEMDEPHWVRFLIGFKDELYVGTQPGLLYRSRDGKEWEEIGQPIRNHRDFFGIRGAAIFKEALYVGSITHGEIWRTEDGVHWTLAFDATPEKEMGYVASMAVYDGRLYAGIRTHSGFVFSTADGTTWEEVGNLTPHTIEAMVPFGGNIYAGTLIPPDANIYRASVAN